MRQVTGVIRTSAVMICTREKDTFYSSVREVPSRLRARLEEATNGSNSGTILIADKGGRERILARAAGLKKEVSLKPLEALNSAPPVWVMWVGGVLLILVTVIIVLVWGKWPNG